MQRQNTQYLKVVQAKKDAVRQRRDEVVGEPPAHVWLIAVANGTRHAQISQVRQAVECDGREGGDPVVVHVSVRHIGGRQFSQQSRTSA